MRTRQQDIVVNGIEEKKVVNGGRRVESASLLRCNNTVEVVALQQAQLDG